VRSDELFEFKLHQSFRYTCKVKCCLAVQTQYPYRCLLIDIHLPAEISSPRRRQNFKLKP